VSGAAGPAPGSLGAWVLAARPKTLPAAVAPVLVGTACAHAASGFSPWPAAASLAGALLLQVGANLANDLFDHEKGADTPDRLGPVRAVQSGLLTPAAVRVGMGAVFALATGVGVYLAWVAGWVVVAIGVCSILAAIAYTGGPYPLGYHGLGDLFVFVFFGLVAVAGTAYVQVGDVPAVAWWATVPVGSLTTAILVVNNLRDIGTDAVAGKRTLAVRLGPRGSVAEYSALLLAAFAVPPAMVAAGELGLWGLLPLAALPLAVARARRIAADRGPELNESLAGTARLLLGFSLLFGLGIVLG